MAFKRKSFMPAGPGHFEESISSQLPVPGFLEEYIFFGGTRIARRDASGAVHYYFADYLGSADLITSNTGAIQKESDYDPYGGEFVVTGSDANHYKFTGKERDAESGLDNFGARYDAPNLGRFMTPAGTKISTVVSPFIGKSNWNHSQLRKKRDSVYTSDNPQSASKQAPEATRRGLAL